MQTILYFCQILQREISYDIFDKIDRILRAERIQ